MSKMGAVLSNLTLLKTYHRRGLGAKPPAAGHYFVIFWGKSCFNATGSHFARAQSHLKELNF